jgi:hypothetical protein
VSCSYTHRLCGPGDGTVTFCVARPPLIFVQADVAAVVVQVCAAGMVPAVGGSWSRPQTNFFAAWVSAVDWAMVKVSVVPTGCAVDWAKPAVIVGGSASAAAARAAVVAETAETAETADEAAAGIISPRTAVAAAAMTGIFNERRMALLTRRHKASPNVTPA